MDLLDLLDLLDVLDILDLLGSPWISLISLDLLDLLDILGSPWIGPLTSRSAHAMKWALTSTILNGVLDDERRHVRMVLRLGHSSPHVERETEAQTFAGLPVRFVIHCE